MVPNEIKADVPETPEQLALQRLRQAIVEEYLEKLPKRMSIRQVAHMLRIPDRRVREVILQGRLIAHEENGSIVVAPTENRQFLLANMLLRLPSPDSLVGTAPQATPGAKPRV